MAEQTTMQVVGPDGQPLTVQVDASGAAGYAVAYSGGEMEALPASDELNLSVDADTSRIAAEVLQEALDNGTLQLLQDNSGQPGVFVTSSDVAAGLPSEGGTAQYTSAVVQGIEGLVELAQGSVVSDAQTPTSIAIVAGSDDRYDFSDAAAMIMTAASGMDDVSADVNQDAASGQAVATSEYASVGDVMKHAVSLAGITSTDALDSSNLE